MKTILMLDEDLNLPEMSMMQIKGAIAARESFMPIDIRVLHNGIGVLYLWHGTVTGKDFIDVNNRLLAFNDRLKTIEIWTRRHDCS